MAALGGGDECAAAASCQMLGAGAARKELLSISSITELACVDELLIEP